MAFDFKKWKLINKPSLLALRKVLKESYLCAYGYANKFYYWQFHREVL